MHLQHVTYTIILACIAFVIYLWLNMLIALYHSGGQNATSSSPLPDSSPNWWRRLPFNANGHLNNGSSGDKEAVEYDRLNTGIDGHSLELAEHNRRKFRGSANASHEDDFDDDALAEDDGGDSYWSGSGDTLADTDAKEIRVR